MLKDLIMIVLGPSNIGFNASKFPYAVNFPIPYSTFTMCVSFDSDFGHIVVCILLMGYTHLLSTYYLIFARLEPCRCADKMLRFDPCVTKKIRIRGHAQKLLGGHGLPDLVEECTVINLRVKKDD